MRVAHGGVGAGVCADVSADAGVGLKLLVEYS